MLKVLNSVFTNLKVFTCITLVSGFLIDVFFGKDAFHGFVACHFLWNIRLVLESCQDDDDDDFDNGVNWEDRLT